MRLTFNFDEGLEENLRVVNQALEGLRIGELGLERLDGSVSTQRRFENDAEVSLRRWYNVLALELDIVPAQDGDCYRLDAEVITMEMAMEHNVYLAVWKARHPGRSVRIIQSSRFGDALMAFIVVSCQA